MTIIYCDGFDYLSPSVPDIVNSDIKGRWTYYPTDVSVGRVAGRVPGTYAINCSNSIGYIRRNWGGDYRDLTVTSGGIAVAVKKPNTLTANIMQICTGSEPTFTQHFRLDINSTHFLQLYVLGVLVATSPVAYDFFNEFIHIETKFNIDNVTGSVEIRIDGNTTPVMTYAGDTQSGTDGTSRFMLLHGSLFGTYFDDLILWDTVGINNDWVGNQHVYTLFPDGPGAFADQTPSAGVNWQNVRDIPHVEDNNFNSGTVGQKDRLAFDDLPPTVLTVGAAQIGTRARKQGSAKDRSVRHVLWDGATEVEGVSRSLSKREYWQVEMFELHPSGPAPWTPAEINAGEFGYKTET